MPKNVIITPATGLVEFKGASGNTDATIQLDDSGNLNLTSPNGDISIGDTTSDILIGDGVTSVDIIFEQNGAVRALTGKTLTIGQSDATVRINSTLQITNTTLVANLNADLLDGLNSSSFSNTAYGNSSFGHANAAFIHANSSFIVANGTAIAANTPSHVANSAAIYANGAFAKANTQDAINLTQNNSITAAFTAANSAGVYANGAFTQANSNYTSAVTKLDVTNSGASAYLIDQYSGNNPSIYVSGGETIAFNLNVSGHPFVIRESSGGANTSNGLIHVSTTGVVSTGASAQGYVTGVLYWKVPFSLVGSTYVYQCTIHGGMVGNIVIQQPASFVAANTTLAFNTANAAFLAANAATATDTTQNNSITAAFAAANSSGVYANGAFAKANTQDNINLTQNNSITAAFAAANAATATDTTQNNSITAAFTRANNSINANTGGTVTANVTISANLTASNVATQTYIQFGDGTKQFTANAGTGGGGTTDQYARDTANAAFIHANSAFDAANTGGGGSANSFGQIVANVGTILATSSNDSLQIVGESGISVSSNVSAKKVIVSVPAGFTFTTADYGFVTDSTNVIFDYGTI